MGTCVCRRTASIRSSGDIVRDFSGTRLRWGNDGSGGATGRQGNCPVRMLLRCGALDQRGCRFGLHISHSKCRYPHSTCLVRLGAPQLPACLSRSSRARNVRMHSANTYEQTLLNTQRQGLLSLRSAPYPGSRRPRHQSLTPAPLPPQDSANHGSPATLTFPRAKST